MSYTLQCKIDALNAQICCLTEAVNDGNSDTGDLSLLQNICDKLEAINATLTAGITVEPGEAWGALLEAAFTAAIEGAEWPELEVTLNGETITVVVDTSDGPIEITGTVTIDQTGGPLLVEVTNFPTEISIDNFQDLVDLLADTTLTVSVTDLPPVVIDGGQFDALIDAIANSDADDTDDDNRPVSPSCYEWAGGSFTGYAVTDETGAFQGWEVLSGTAPTGNEPVECVVKFSNEPVAQIVPPDVEYVCNDATGFYDQVVVEYVDGVPQPPVVTATTLVCVGEAIPETFINVSHVCNEDTGFYDQVTITTIDGVEQTPVVTATTISCDDSEPVVTVDFEYPCNTDTGFYDQITNTTTDGVTVSETEPTTIRCLPDEIPDVEQVRVCDPTTETTHILTTTFYADGTEVVISDIDTLESCKDCLVPFTPECIKRRIFKVGYDNGFTPGSSYNDCGERVNLVRFNETFTVKHWLVNGQQVGAGDAFGPFASWTAQLQGWAAWFNANDPNSSSNAAYGVAGKPTWRYAEITGCDPTAEYGPLTLVRDDGCEFVIYPVLTSDITDFGYRHGLYNCDEDTKEIVFCDADGARVETPADASCWMPCSYIYPPYVAEIVSPCTISEIRDLCDLQADGSTVGFVQIINLCDGDLFVESYTTESWNTAESADDLVEYVITGSVVSCATGEPVTYPEIVKSIDEAVSCEPLPCSDEAGGDCDCPATLANYDPDQGSQWDAISVVGGLATIEAGPNGTGSFHEQMNGSNPQCDGDLWLARMGAYDGPPGGGANLVAEGYVLASKGNVTGVTGYMLGAPVLPSPCSAESLEADLVAGGFNTVEAESLVSNGYASVDVLGAGGTHINGVFDPGASTPFGLCITLDTSGCEAANTVVEPYVRTFDECVLAEQQKTNELLQQLIDCLCPPCESVSDEPVEGTEAECAVEKTGLQISSVNAGEIVNDGVWAGGPNATTPANGWTITDIKVTDSAGTVHLLGVNSGDTVSGAASGSTTGVTVTGFKDSTREDGTVYRCTVTDRAISSSTVVA